MPEFVQEDANQEYSKFQENNNILRRCQKINKKKKTKQKQIIQTIKIAKAWFNRQGK